MKPLKEMELSLSCLPDEVYYEIASHLPIRYVLYLGLSCKKVWRGLRYYKSYDGQLKSFTLSVDQQEALERLKVTTKPVVTLKAPPSMGKTVLTLSYLLEQKKLSLLIVPPGLISSWLTELEKSFFDMFSENPLDTKVLVWHSSHKKHFNHAKTNGIPRNTQIVIISTLFARKVDVTSYDFIVIDEAHKHSRLRNLWCRNSQVKARHLLISASHIPCYREDDKEEIDISNTVVKEVVPRYREHYREEGLDETLLVVFSSHKRAILFMGAVGDYRDFNLPSDVKVFYHRTQKRLVESFNENEGRCLLVSTYGKLGVGHNLVADAAILDQADGKNVNVLLQAESRLLRVSNRTPEVSFYLLCHNKALLRYRIALLNIERTEDIRNAKQKGLRRVINGSVASAFYRFGIDGDSLSDLQYIYHCNPEIKTGKFRRLWQREGIVDKKMEKKLTAFYEEIEKKK